MSLGKSVEAKSCFRSGSLLLVKKTRPFRQHIFLVSEQNLTAPQRGQSYIRGRMEDIEGMNDNKSLPIVGM
ncbi:hypothetical protein Tco_1422474 [Tanacetum coccineum]